MSDHDRSTLKPEGDRNPVSFAPDERRQLCSAVAVAVSEVLGQMPIRVDFHASDAVFLVEIIGQAPPGQLN